MTLDPRPPRPQWMVVLSTNNPGEAHIVAGLLQSQGIATWVHQEPYGSAMGIYVGKLGEVRVLVLPDDYERALAVLEDESLHELPEDVDQIVFGDEFDDDSPADDDFSDDE